MNCCQCQGIEDLYNDPLVSKELAQYRDKGSSKTSHWMVDALKVEGVADYHLLDIGGGLGAVQHALIEAGVKDATDLDVSKVYIKAARQDSERRGIAERVRFQHGNFVDLAPQIPSVDIVTLDRVVCCYPDMENLVRLSAARATKLYGLVYPRYAWWVMIGMAILNVFFKLQRKPFCTYVHPTGNVDALVRRKGLRPRFFCQTLLWQVWSTAAKGGGSNAHPSRPVVLSTKSKAVPAVLY